MAESYAYSDGSFYRFTEEAGRTVGQDVTQAEAADAVPELVEDWLAGRLLAMEKVAPGARAEERRVTDAEFAANVIQPAFDAAMNGPGSPADHLAAIRTLLGDDKEVILLFASVYDEAMAEAVWGVKFVDATDHRASPATPVAAPATAIVGALRTQGHGTVPRIPGGRGGPRRAGGAKGDPRTGGDPVILFSGQLLVECDDLEVPGRGLHFRFARTYLHQTGYRGPLGYGWDHTYNLWLREEQETEPGGRVVDVVYRSTGRVRADRFVAVSPAVVGADPDYAAPPGVFDTLVRTGRGFVCRLATGVEVHYGAETLLAERIVDLNGNVLSLEYDAENRLSAVVDPVGKRFGFAHDEMGRLVEVRDELGARTVRYGFDDAGDLVSVEVAAEDGTLLETDYVYAAAPLAHRLTTVQDQGGAFALVVEYGTDPGDGAWDRVVRQLDGTGEWTYGYATVADPAPAEVDADADPLNVPLMSTTVVSPRGHPVEHWFNAQGNVVYTCEPSYDGDGGLVEWRHRYNADGLPVLEIRPDGGSTVQSYGREAYVETGGDPETAPANERRLFGALRRTVVHPTPGLGEDRTIVAEADHGEWLHVVAERGPYWADAQGAALVSPSEVTFHYDARWNLEEIVLPDVVALDGGVRPGPRQRFGYDAHGELIRAEVAGVVTRYEKFTDEVRSGFTAAVVRDPGGAAIRTTYDIDALGRVERLTAARGAAEAYGYDGLGRLRERRVLEPDGREGREWLDRDQVGRIVAWHRTDEAPAGASPAVPRARYWRHDALGRVVVDGEGVAPSAREHRHVLGPDGRIDRSRDPAGLLVELRRDPAGRVTRVTAAPGRPEASWRGYRWHADGRLAAVYDADGDLVTFGHDAFGRRSGRRDRDGVRLDCELDAVGRAVAHTVSGDDGRWARTECGYDVLGRMYFVDRHRFVPPSALTEHVLRWTFDHDDAGRVILTVDPAGAPTTAAFDPLGRPLEAQDADGVRRTWTWDDAAGTILIRTSAPGATPMTDDLRLATDAWGRPTELRDGASNVTRYDYDTAGRLVRTSGPAGADVLRRYDGFGELAEVEVTGIGRTTFERDARGELARVVHPSGLMGEVQRDALGRPVRVDTAAAPVTFEWRPDGLLAATTDAAGTRCELAYTPGGRLRHSACDHQHAAGPYPPAQTAPVTFAWTPLDTLAAADDGTTSVQWTVDSLGLPLGETVTGSHGTWTFAATHDDAGRPATLVHPDGRRVGWDWSPGGRCAGARLLDAGATGLGVPGAPRELVSFDRAGDYTLGAHAGGAAAAVGHDPAGRPAEVVWSDASGAPLRAEQRVYGARGESRLVHADRVLSAADHDGGDRLVGLREHAPAPALDLAPVLARDADGLPLATQAGLDAIVPGPLPAARRDVRWTLDAAGARVTTDEAGIVTSEVAGPGGRVALVGADACTYDGAGRLVACGARSYGYDDRGRLISIDDGAGRRAVLAWDPLGRPLAIDDGDGPRVLRHFGGHLVETTSGGAPNAQLTWAAGRLWNIAEAGGDAGVICDLAGTVVGTLTIGGIFSPAPETDPFGVSAETATRVAGYRSRTGVGGVWLFPARVYEPRLGRFLQTDPAGLAGDAHPYLYAEHSPLRLDDAWGLGAGPVNWGIVARSAAPPLLLGVGAAFAVGALIGAGLVSAPFVLVAGGLLLAATAIYSYRKHSIEAVEAGVTDYEGRAALAAAGDLVGATAIYEGWTGHAAMTGSPLPTRDRSERLGNGFGTAGATLLGGRVSSFGREILGAGAAPAELAASVSASEMPKSAPATAPAAPPAPHEPLPPPPDPATEQSFAGVLQPDSAPVTPLKSVPAAAKEAAASMLVNQDSPGLGSYATASPTRSALSLTGAQAEAAHLVPQAVGELIKINVPNAGYSPGKALTNLLPPGTHGAFDDGWVPLWNQAVKAGGQITAGDVEAMVGQAIDQIPGNLLSPAYKATLRWRLFLELYGEVGLKGDLRLGLTPSTVIRPKIP